MKATFPNKLRNEESTGDKRPSVGSTAVDKVKGHTLNRNRHDEEPSKDRSYNQTLNLNQKKKDSS